MKEGTILYSEFGYYGYMDTLILRYSYLMNSAIVKYFMWSCLMLEGTAKLGLVRFQRFHIKSAFSDGEKIISKKALGFSGM